MGDNSDRENPDICSNQVLDPKTKKPIESETDFIELKIKDAEGKDVLKYKCNICDHKVSNKTAMKRHVTAKHKKKEKSVAKENTEKVTLEDVPEESLENFNYDLLDLERREEEDDENFELSLESSPIRVGQGTPEINSLDKARETIANLGKELEAEIAKSKEESTKLLSMDSAMKEMSKESGILRGRNDTLEIENMEKEEKFWI